LSDDLRHQLAACLPGLGDDDLQSLATRTSHELEYRVGEALSNRLTDEQLIEFQQLRDRDEGEQCTPWLETNIPGYKATIAIVRAKLIAEVIEAVASADPPSVIGSRGFAEVFATSLDLIEAHCRAREIKYTRTDDTVYFLYAATESQPVVGISVRMRAGGPLLEIVGTAPEASFPAQARDALNEFASNWNLTTWLPKAVIATDSDESDRFRLRGEFATPLPPRVTRTHLDTVIAVGVATICNLFRDARVYPGLVTLGCWSNAWKIEIRFIRAVRMPNLVW
jgi:hypothetical protein